MTGWDAAVTIFAGFEGAFLGFANVWDSSGHRVERAVYSGPRIAEILIRRDGLSPEDAQEFIDFNVEDAYVGPDTPIVIWPSYELAAVQDHR